VEEAVLFLVAALGAIGIECDEVCEYELDRVVKVEWGPKTRGQTIIVRVW
jgi:hypothetical protein